MHRSVGQADESDQLTNSATLTLSVVATYEGGRMRYEGTVTLDRSDPFGYTARVLPPHRLLAGPAESGLVAAPSGGPVSAPDNGFLLR